MLVFFSNHLNPNTFSAYNPLFQHHNDIYSCIINSQFIFLIKSSFNDHDKGVLLRNYFEKQSNIFTYTFQWFFFIGESQCGNDNVDLDNDMVQVDFADTYLNNTLKLCAETFWLSDNLCRRNTNQRIILLNGGISITKIIVRKASCNRVNDTECLEVVRIIGTITGGARTMKRSMISSLY